MSLSLGNYEFYDKSNTFLLELSTQFMQLLTAFFSVFVFSLGSSGTIFFSDTIDPTEIVVAHIPNMCLYLYAYAMQVAKNSLIMHFVVVIVTY